MQFWVKWYTVCNEFSISSSQLFFVSNATFLSAMKSQTRSAWKFCQRFTRVSKMLASFFRILYQKTFSFFVVMLHNSSPNFGSSITSKILSRRRKIYEAERQPSIGLLALSFCAMHNFIDKKLVAKTAKANSSERKSPQKSQLNFHTKNYIFFVVHVYL